MKVLSVFFIQIFLVFGLLGFNCFAQTFDNSVSGYLSEIQDLEKDDESLKGSHTLSIVTDNSSGCQAWIQASPDSKIESTKWSGQCIENLASGHGVLSVKFANSELDSARYTGTFINGFINGYGELREVQSRGASPFRNYNGHWLNGHRHGYGEQISLTSNSSNRSEGKIVSSATYKGQFEQNELWGDGEFTFFMKYQDRLTITRKKSGSWQKHKLHGLGIETIERVFPIGDVFLEKYEGTWKSDSRVGFGRMTEFKNDELLQTHEGEFQGSFHGNGKYWDGSNENMFNGMWKSGMPEEGICKLKHDDFNGKCRRYHYRPEHLTGISCLSNREGIEHCLGNWQTHTIFEY